MNEKIEKSINDQMNFEIYSAYLYLSMSAYFQSVSLSGFAKWMEIQAAEEFSHFKKFYNFLVEMSGNIELQKIDAPSSKWDSAENIFQDALNHEKKVTSNIYNMVDLALSEKDHAANAMLQWFVSEQVEEEATANEILDKIKLVGNNGHGLLLIDQELGQRTLGPVALQNIGLQ